MLEAQTGSDMWIPVEPPQLVGHTQSPASHLAPHWHSTPWHKSEKHHRYHLLHLIWRLLMTMYQYVWLYV